MMPATGYWVLDKMYWMLEVCYWMLSKLERKKRTPYIIATQHVLCIYVDALNSPPRSFTLTPASKCLVQEGLTG